MEQLGSVSSELFANGVPCAGTTQCTSGNCIDGVCCNTACGAGARDLQACSNVYGVVPGLVNGTCKTLVAGDACGSLTTVNPCSWRGTVVNGGNNCPNPPGGASACFPCVTSADCSGGFPACVAGACVACTGDNGTVTAAPCPVTTPACTNGQCVQCTTTNVTACAGVAPTCDVATNTCGSCNGDKGSGATRPCQSAGTPACLANGTCAACSATNTTACNGGTPTCVLGTNTCAACNGDNASAATQACPTTANPYCNLAGGNAGSCGTCVSNLDCGAGHTGATCNAAGACADVCTLDTDCAVATQWCATGVCTTKTANGELLPATAPINATCTVANGTRVCASGVCSTADNRCGLLNGSTCAPAAPSVQCRSGTCFAGDNKCGAPVGQPCVAQNDCRSNICPPSNKCGDCQTDVTCGTTTSGKVCDDLAKTCGAGCRGTGGNGCAAGFVCTSTNATIGKCVQCLSDTTCGSVTSGQVCNPTSSTCQPGCRGSGGNACPAGSTCSSVDGTIGTCTECTTDATCGGPTSGVICNDAKTCQPGCRGTGGNTCAVGEKCSSTDATAGTCSPLVPPALDAGSGCTKDTDCGAATSGRICDTTSGTCRDGCRGQDGNGCSGQGVCTSTTSSAGSCAPAPVVVPVEPDGALVEGGGLSCAVTSTGTGRGAPASGLALLLLLGASLFARRSRSRARAHADADADQQQY